MARTVSLLVSLVLGATATALATDIAWRSTLFQSNEDSAGNPLDGSWTFYLGYFTGGFLPGSGNTADWSANWETVSATVYDEGGARFVSEWENDGSVPVNTKGYLWGVNRNGETQEWILLSDATWLWPSMADNPLDASDDQVDWLVMGAGQVIVGQVDTGGVHMKTAAVAAGAPPFLDGDGWRALHFSPAELADPMISGWSADADGDGGSNLWEFATGSNPRKATSFRGASMGMVESGGAFLTVTVSKARNVGVLYRGQVCGNLAGWNTGAPHVVVQSESDNEITFRDTTPWAPGLKRFGRVLVELAP